MRLKQLALAISLIMSDPQALKAYQKNKSEGCDL